MQMEFPLMVRLTAYPEAEILVCEGSPGVALGYRETRLRPPAEIGSG
jgi:hypothetical protein